MHYIMLKITHYVFVHAHCYCGRRQSCFSAIKYPQSATPNATASQTFEELGPLQQRITILAPKYQNLGTSLHVGNIHSHVWSVLGFRHFSKTIFSRWSMEGA
jgi:hypothetical protein